MRGADETSRKRPRLPVLYHHDELADNMPDPKPGIGGGRRVASALSSSWTEAAQLALGIG